MYKLIITKAAENDLRNAVFYIAYDLKNEAAANRLLDETDKQLSALCDMPECNQLVRDSFLASKGIRIKIIGKYLAFYVIREESKSITVLQFLHSRRDWTSILTDEIIDNS